MCLPRPPSHPLPPSLPPSLSSRLGSSPPATPPRPPPPPLPLALSIAGCSASWVWCLGAPELPGWPHQTRSSVPSDKETEREKHS